MTTLIFIENVLGSGHVVKLTEDFDSYSVSRDLRPGEHTRVIVSPFKTISMEEVPLKFATADDGHRIGAPATSRPPVRRG